MPILVTTIKTLSAIASIWTWLAFKRHTKRAEQARKLQEWLDTVIRGTHARI